MIFSLLHGFLFIEPLRGSLNHTAAITNDVSALCIRNSHSPDSSIRVGNYVVLFSTNKAYQVSYCVNVVINYPIDITWDKCELKYDSMLINRGNKILNSNFASKSYHFRKSEVTESFF